MNSKANFIDSKTDTKYLFTNIENIFRQVFDSFYFRFWF